ncbi:hypothetical protein S40285_10484 [Stachybotrys chlorohalonatus IBT 40285]|uniref:Secreted protein n=1 Tax=Stachybotrys chlorohalonatus (strain IBT 40285) TaxID=1283841 RepID=A0A084QAW2_STAC4|nr:hypothetical protein S40285_10484 [Stachybotrys chlorohalonata IBT 40285]
MLPRLLLLAGAVPALAVVPRTTTTATVTCTTPLPTATTSTDTSQDTSYMRPGWERIVMLPPFRWLLPKKIGHAEAARESLGPEYVAHVCASESAVRASSMLRGEHTAVPAVTKTWPPLRHTEARNGTADSALMTNTTTIRTLDAAGKLRPNGRREACRTPCFGLGFVPRPRPVPAVAAHIFGAPPGPVGPVLLSDMPPAADRTKTPASVDGVPTTSASGFRSLVRELELTVRPSPRETSTMLY